MKLNDQIAAVTRRIEERSAKSRARYLDMLDRARSVRPSRARLDCANLAHGFAACSIADKDSLKSTGQPNIGIVTAYNDMLSAHQPYEGYPERIRDIARQHGATAQVAGGVPAMCDGVTQGRWGMELSLFSRDTIALSTALALSHDMFDAALLLGICDKIVPGLFIGALRFGHLPMIFVPSGPMPTGTGNAEKAAVRQRYAEGKASRAELLESESNAYHAPGTCTFYGTANTNQMLMEIMGLHLPGASFVNPGTPEREAFTEKAVARAAALAKEGNSIGIGNMVEAKTIVNGIAGLHATGGSTNLLLHFIVMARAAGHIVTLEDFHDLSAVVPLLARVYPNGMADVNAFSAAGGMAFIIGELLDGGFLHEDVNTVAGHGLAGYAGTGAASRDLSILRPHTDPFRADGGLKILSGNLGKAAIKLSSVRDDRLVIEAPARVFSDQGQVKAAFEAGELDRDVVVVVRFQGPKANGMPELHKLTPLLGVLQDKGFRVALVTDGRMSGASGKVPAAIHVTPEACAGGLLARVQDGDIIRLDAMCETLDLLADAAELEKRAAAAYDPSCAAPGLGRELFAPFRSIVSGAEHGATIFGEDSWA